MSAEGASTPAVSAPDPEQPADPEGVDPGDAGDSGGSGHRLRKATPALVLGALGVVFGDIGTSPLYVGPYTPEIVPGGHSAALVQNFTVTVPDYLQPGAAVIAVAHFSLILVSGPGNFLLLARGKESTDEWFS